MDSQKAGENTTNLRSLSRGFQQPVPEKFGQQNKYS